MKKIFLIILLTIGAGIIYFKFFNCRGANCSQDTNTNQIGGRSVESETDIIKKVYQNAKQDLKQYPNLEKDAEQQLLEQEIVEQYAQEHALSVSKDELNNHYKTLVLKFGGLPQNDLDAFNAKREQNYLHYLEETYTIDKSEYLKRLEFELLKAKVTESLEKPYPVWLSEQKAQKGR